MKAFEHLSADTRLTDELERELLQEALRAQLNFNIASGLRHVAGSAVRKIAALLNSPRKGKGLPAEYLYS